MATVRLTNGGYVPLPDSICSEDTMLLSLIDNLAWSNPLGVRYKSLNVLKELGVIAIEAVKSLELIIKTENNAQFVLEALSALEKISPERHLHMHNRFDSHNGRSYLCPEVPETPSLSYGPHVGYRTPNVGNGNNFNSTQQGPIKKEEKKVERKPKIEVNLEVELVPVSNASNLESNSKVYRKCFFCEHETLLTPVCKNILDKLCPPGKFYCPFCLRHNYHTRDSKHIMMLTFRGIFGYFYYELYSFPKTFTNMYMSEIQDHIDLHVAIGMQNPVFSYNPENYCWFIDFRKIGQSKKKQPLEIVYSTVAEILASFNLQYNIRSVQLNKLYEKYREAIEKFYKERYRPDGQKLCVPTLKGCGVTDWTFGTCSVNTVITTSNKLSLDDTKMFLPSMMAVDKYWSKATV